MTTSIVSTTASNLDCEVICSSDSGTAGNCCDSNYCDCSSKETINCPGDQVYCNEYQSCEEMGGQTCSEGLTWCCADDNLSMK